MFMLVGLGAPLGKGAVLKRGVGTPFLTLNIAEMRSHAKAPLVLAIQAACNLLRNGSKT